MTEHEKLIERVAMAIYKAQGGKFEHHGAMHMTHAATTALAAVHAALQEPTWMNDGDYVGQTPRQAWDTMLDASPLKEVDG